MEPMIHTVQYYETDKMGITHHANYIHWMEEARVTMMEQLGYSYARLEQEGIASPVTGISFDYKSTSTFMDRVAVSARFLSFNGVIAEIGYTMTDAASGRLIGEGVSRHAFVEPNGRISRLKRDHPAFYAWLLKVMEEQKEEEASR